MALTRVMTYLSRTARSGLLSVCPAAVTTSDACVRSVCHKSQKKRRRFRRLERDMTWAEPILEYRAEKQQQAEGAESEEAEPHMLHAVWRVRSLLGRPWWEKDIIHKLGLTEQQHHPVVHKNIPSVNDMLKEVKHLLVIKPLTFPQGVPDHESDFDHMYVKPSGEVVIKRRIDALEPAQGENQEPAADKWTLDLTTLRKDLDQIRQSHRIHKEYHRARYTYRKNQDGKEYRYNMDKDVPPYRY